MDDSASLKHRILFCVIYGWSERPWQTIHFCCENIGFYIGSKTFQMLLNLPTAKVNVDTLNFYIFMINTLWTSVTCSAVSISKLKQHIILVSDLGVITVIIREFIVDIVDWDNYNIGQLEDLCPPELSYLMLLLEESAEKWSKALVLGFNSSV